MLSTKSVQDQPVAGDTQATNGAQGLIDIETPYVAHITIKGTAEVTIQAGKLVGVGDFRPTYGRFQVVKFETGLE